ncbi:MAG: orotate phosphoribosyltransferase [Bacteroidia bacterium]|nr:MAG: orotate phosphoribosyltransferase [Bacteroidia bacterium]
MTRTNRQLANLLLEIKAVKLQPENPFSWASGWISPIYCDNRKTLSYPKVREFIKANFVAQIKEKYSELDVIAGVATGGIAHGVLVAQEMGLPFVYVRSSAKAHGLENKIEGDLKAGQKVVVLEDLVSTGKSSLNAVEAIRNAGGIVLGMCAIFSYEFEIAARNFQNKNCKLSTISEYSTLLDAALETGYIHEKQVEKLKQWRLAPEKWGKNDE